MYGVQPIFEDNLSTQVADDDSSGAVEINPSPNVRQLQSNDELISEIQKRLASDLEFCSKFCNEILQKLK